MRLLRKIESDDKETRENICKGLEFSGVEFDSFKNKVRGQLTEISKESPRVKIYIIPTDEEIMIAKETRVLVKE